MMVLPVRVFTKLSSGIRSSVGGRAAEDGGRAEAYICTVVGEDKD